jgi:hypothetical protein
MSSDWQNKVLEQWRIERSKSAKQREAEAARQEAARIAMDERFFTAYPHLRPTPERLAALKDGKCAHCSRGYPEWEHVAHYYCSHVCSLAAAAST